MHVLLIDDHALFRRGLRLMLADLDPDIRFTEAGDCAAAAALHDLRPDLVLLDLHMPGSRGLDALVFARSAFEAAPLVVLSGEEEPPLIRRAIESGAAGFVPKSSTPEVLQSALRLILAGGVYLPPHALRGLSSIEATPPRDATPPTASVGTAASAPRPAPIPALASTSASAPASALRLSERQNEVLQRAIQGKSNKLIARELGVSEGTVKAHLSASFRALGVANRTEAVYAAARLGMTAASGVAAG